MTRLSRRAALGAAVGSAGGILGCARTALDLDDLRAEDAGAAGSGFSGAGGSPGATFHPERVPEDVQRFDLGVQAGEVTERSALFWTHATVGEPLELCVWPEGTEPNPTSLLCVTARPSPAGFVHQHVGGLEPSMRYRYAFLDSRRAFRSVVGRMRTAPAADRAETLLLGALACTNFAYLPYRTAELLAREPLDFFVHTGDMSYNDGARTPADFSEKWRTTLGSSGYRALLAATGAYFTWDDHEVTNDFDAEALEQFDLEFFTAAREAYFASVAKRPNPVGGLWQSFHWGRTAELFVLDCRGERRPSTLGSARPTFVSDAQLDWLREGLLASRSVFKIVVTSVPIGRLSDELYARPENRWEGYAAQREELLAFIDQRGIENVWFLSGDLHMGLVHRVDRAGRDARHWEICAGPGGQSTHDRALFGADEARRAQAFPPEQVAYASPDLAYTTLELDPSSGTVRVRFVDVEGSTAFDRVLHQ